MTKEDEIGGNAAGGGAKVVEDVIEATLARNRKIPLPAKDKLAEAEARVKELEEALADVGRKVELVLPRLQTAEAVMHLNRVAPKVLALPAEQTVVNELRQAQNTLNVLMANLLPY